MNITEAPFQKIPAASKTTGLSQYFCGRDVGMGAFRTFDPAAPF